MFGPSLKDFLWKQVSGICLFIDTGTQAFAEAKVFCMAVPGGPVPTWPYVFSIGAVSVPSQGCCPWFSFGALVYYFLSLALLARLGPALRLTRLFETVGA